MGELPFAFERSSSQALRREAEEHRASSDRAESTNGHARSGWVPNKYSGCGRDGASARRTCALAPPKPKELTPTMRSPLVAGKGSRAVGTRSFSATKSMFGLGVSKCRLAGI